MAEMNPGDLFPKVQNVITIEKAIDALASHHNSSFRWKLHYDRPFATLTKTKTEAHRILDAKGIKRFINLRELKIGGSYPLDYNLSNYEIALALIGNSVPPLFMYSIAGTIRERLFRNYTMPDRNGNEYLDILEAAWQDHLKLKELGAPTVISLFAGCGGSSLGYSMAGYRELLAVEWDDNAVATFKLNFPDIPVYHGDIHNLSIDECLKLAGLEPGELDVLDGSPPCQGFSTAGKRRMDDKRNQLYMEYIRLLRGLKPKVLIMENVSGLVKGKMKLIFADIMRELKASGYKVSCRLMNTMYFNVPQSRQRLIWIGVREDLGIEAGHPKGQSKPIIVREAWKGICNSQNEIDYAHSVIQSRSRSIAPILAKAKAGQQLSTIESRGFYYNWQRLHLEKPSPVVPKEDINLCHPIDMRIITPTECKRVTSFPDGFLFIGQPKQRRECIGNSIPPLFMKSIAEHVRTEILDPQRID